MYELANVSATVTSHDTLLPLFHGLIDAPSGRFREKPEPSRGPHCALKPAGSFNACILALDSERQMTSFRIYRALCNLPEFFLYAKLQHAGIFHRCCIRRYKCMAGTKQNPIAHRLQSYEFRRRARGPNCRKV